MICLNGQASFNIGKMIIKTIFQGRLDFGSAKSFGQVRSMYEQRVTNFYRSDVFIKEEAFNEDTYSLVLPKFIAEGNKRTWENTIKVLRYISDFAVAGSVRAYITDRGESKANEHIVANPERNSMKSYTDARRQLREGGSGIGVIELLNEAIEKYDRHAQALELRAFVWNGLGEYERAFEDFSRAIEIDPNLAEAYFHRGEMLYELGRQADAIEDFSVAIKHSVPVRSLFWAARRLKGDCHYETGDSRNAAVEYRFFCMRNFELGSENYNKMREVCLRYAEVLLEEGKAEDALKVVDGAIKMEVRDDNVTAGDLLLLRGLALKRANRPGYASVLKEAAKAGSAKAADMLGKALA